MRIVPQVLSSLFRVSPDEGKQDALEVAKFFRDYPSNGGAQLVAFRNTWAVFETFDDIPLQAFLYKETKPQGADGKPRSPEWAAYMNAVDTGQSAERVETAFLRAHSREILDLFKSPKFDALYAASTPAYRKVVDAYRDTMSGVVRDLNDGVSALSISRTLFLRTNKDLLVRGTTGFTFTKEGLKNLLHVTDPLVGQMLSAYVFLGKHLVFGTEVSRPEPRAAWVSLEAADAARLSQKTGIAFSAGIHKLTPDDLPAGFLISDFGAKKALRNERQAGADGVLSASDIEAVIRNVNARERSNRVADFHAKYPVPVQGLLMYSASMLALNGAYGESTMFDALASAIMPADKSGKPKNALWQAYVDGHKAGLPQNVLTKLWLDAHMNDFAIIETPGFQEELKKFWAAADLDPVLEPLAIYTRAMVTGRSKFDDARNSGATDKDALRIAAQHATATIAKSGTLPFWREDVDALKKLATDWRDDPAKDQRGLPTDKTLTLRSLEGLKDVLRFIPSLV